MIIKIFSTSQKLRYPEASVDNMVAVKSLGSLRFVMFVKEVSYAHGCIIWSKNVKIVRYYKQFKINAFYLNIS